MRHQCRFINHNKWTTVVRDTDSWGGRSCCGVWGVGIVEWRNQKDKRTPWSVKIELANENHTTENVQEPFFFCSRKSWKLLLQGPEFNTELHYWPWHGLLRCKWGTGCFSVCLSTFRKLSETRCQRRG